MTGSLSCSAFLCQYYLRVDCSSPPSALTPSCVTVFDIFCRWFVRFVLDDLWMIWNIDYLRLFVVGLFEIIWRMNYFGLLVDYLWIICLDYLLLKLGDSPASPSFSGSKVWVSVNLKESKVLLTALGYGPSPSGPARSMKRVYSVTQHFYCLAGRCATQAHAASTTHAAAHWLVLMAVVRIWAAGESEECKQTHRLSSVIP